MKNILHNLSSNSVDASAKVRVGSRLHKATVSARVCIEKGCRIIDSRFGPDGHVGKRCKLRSVDAGANISIGPDSRIDDAQIGRFTYMARAIVLADIHVGSFCSIGPGVVNHLGNHPTRDFVSTHPAFYMADAPTESFVQEDRFSSFGGTVTVGHDVWIGADALLMDGVSIGDGAVVAARSVVTRDVPPYAIVGGLPAKVIRHRFVDSTIEKLLALKWWEKDMEWIRRHTPLFGNVKDLLERMEP